MSAFIYFECLPNTPFFGGSIYIYVALVLSKSLNILILQELEVPKITSKRYFKLSI
jgi:hypothetical protein